MTAPNISALLSPNAYLSLPSPTDEPTVMSQLLQLLSGPTSPYLTTTAWQPLGVARTLLVNLANVVAEYSGIELFETECGYVENAAALLDTGNNPITLPLDTVAEQVYYTFRSPATYASGLVPLVNTGAPFTAGALTLGLKSTITGATYTNLTSVFVPTGASSATFTARDSGAGSTVAAGTILVPDPPVAGLSCGSTTADMIGLDAGSNPDTLAACQAQLVPVSPAGASDVWRLLAVQTDPDVVRVHVVSNPAPSQVSVFLATALAPASAGQVAAITAAYNEGAVAGGVTLSVSPAGVTIVVMTGFVFIPVGSPTTAIALRQAIFLAVRTYLGNLPIGGLNSTGGLVIPFSGVQAAVVGAAQQAVGPTYAPGVIVELSLNGTPHADVPTIELNIAEVVNLLGVVFAS